MTDHTRRFVLLQRLADRPVEQWHLDDESAMTILGALGAPPSVPDEIVIEMAQIVEHMKKGQALVEHQHRRLRRAHRVTIWLNFAVSAMFFGSYLNSGRLVELVCSVVWLGGPIALGFFHRRSTTP